MKHFNRLYNMVMEDVKSPKLQRRGHIVSEGKCSELRKLHCITVGQAKAQLANLDPNTELYVHSIDEKGETWDDCVVMGFEDWSDDYAVIDRDLFDRKPMTAGELLNNLQDIPDNRFFASLAYATYAHKPDYVKEIQPDGTIIVDMAWFPYNGEEGAPCRLDLQSVKVDESKKVIKESASIQEEMDAIRVAADIIKRAMAVNKDEVLEQLEEDVNYDSSCCAFEDYDGEGITREMWENSIKYGWMAETLPYFIDWHDDLFEDIEITPEERAILEKADNNAYVFSDEFEKGNLEGLDFCKEICSQFDVEIDPEELMIRFAGEDDDMDYESVKKPVSKRRVIKEHKAHRPSRRRVIRESARKHARRHLIKEWSYGDFIRVNKERIQKIFDRLFSDPETKQIYKQNLKKDVVRQMKNSVHHDDPSDPEETAAYVLEKYIYQLRWNGNIYALLTDEQKVWVKKYCDRFLEGEEGYIFNLYEGNGGFYEKVCKMDPIYKEIVDEIVQENGGPVPSGKKQEELYKLALDLFENYKWSSDEAQEAFQADYPSFKRDFIDAYGNYPITNEEFIKEFTRTMDYYNNGKYLEESKKADKRRQVIKESARLRRHAKKIIKESVANVENYKKFLSMCADIVIKSGPDAKKIFVDENVNYDSSATIDQDLADNNVTLEQWENSVKYGWIVDSLPFAISYDSDYFKAATPKQLKQVEEFTDGDDHNFTNHFFYAFCEGNTTDVEFCKQLCEKLGVTDPDKEALMIDEYFEGDDMDYESVKKPVRRRHVIKESAKRPVKRHIRRQIKK